ncbi:MAG: hypothetical protein ACHQ2Y_01480 [Candidatus Lutacidiplasmatales archaeon]
MVAYSDQGVQAVSRERLWKFLELHLDDAVIPRIHPDIVSQRTVQSSGNEHVLERNIRFFGKVRRSLWKVTYEPPDRTRWEILESDGPMLKGCHIENTYADGTAGTLVRSQGEIAVAIFPRFLQKRIAYSALNGIDAQDAKYLAQHPEIGA